jgi:hypothetical protein
LFSWSSYLVLLLFLHLLFPLYPPSSLQCIFIIPPPHYLSLQNSPIESQCFVEFHTIFQSRSTCFISTPFLHTVCSSITNMGVVDSSETLVCFYQTKCHYISVLMINAVRASHITQTALHFIKMRTIKCRVCYYNYFI